MPTYIVFVYPPPTEGTEVMPVTAMIVKADDEQTAVEAVIETRIFPPGDIHACDLTATQSFVLEHNPAVTPKEPAPEPAPEPEPEPEPEPGPLAAVFSWTPDPQAMNFPVQFDASASTGDPVRYDWVMGGKVGPMADAGPTPTATYDKNGTYTVRLTVTDSGGATAETSQQIQITT